MDQIPAEFWWLAVCLNTILLPAGSALGAWLLHKAWPVFIENRRDLREYRQETENAALALAKETIEWSREELGEQQQAFKDLQTIISQQSDRLRSVEYRIKSLETKNTILVSLISDIYERLFKQRPAGRRYE